MVAEQSYGRLAAGKRDCLFTVDRLTVNKQSLPLVGERPPCSLRHETSRGSLHASRGSLYPLFFYVYLSCRQTTEIERLGCVRYQGMLITSGTC